jgi:hypothetical protein
VGDAVKIFACIQFGEWRWHPGHVDHWQATKLHNAEIRHHPQCDGNCDATRAVEQTRAEGRLVGKPRHQIRAATNGN